MAALALASLLWCAGPIARAETVGERLWIWGHPAGVYNAGFLRPMKLVSTIEPVDAASRMGVKNMIFVRYVGNPTPPFDAYYAPFRKLDRVYWSLVGAGGGTSPAEREAVFSLAGKNKNLAGFILDDFFHEPAEGNAADPLPSPRLWFADNGPAFPVTFTVRPRQSVQCDALELVQTDWRTGDYRTKDVAVDLSADGKTWQEVARGTLANRPGAAMRLPLPATRFAEVRLRFLSTYDQPGAWSVGLTKLRFLSAGQSLDAAGWKASASSTYPGYAAAGALGIADSPDRPFCASLSPVQLHELRQRQVRGRKLPLMAVVYTRQVKPGARAHIAEVDQLCLWTWQPGDLKHLEANFAALEKLAPDKELYLGCYMFNFYESKPLPVAFMQRQVELGYQWLKAGRIAGMIFLATPNVDVGLDAVEWTRRWIRNNADQPLPKARTSAASFPASTPTPWRN
jgi:hypothetical protein